MTDKTATSNGGVAQARRLPVAFVPFPLHVNTEQARAMAGGISRSALYSLLKVYGVKRRCGVISVHEWDAAVRREARYQTLKAER